MTSTMIDLLTEEMQDLYDAEKQLVKALPKMVKAASNEDLSQAFEDHLQQTQGQVQRLERAFEILEKKAKGKPCAGMKGLVSEAQERIKSEKESEESFTDLAMICAAQKVEHYEIAGYGTVKAWAEELGLNDVAKLMEETLNEEKEADQKLTEIAQGILANSSDEDIDEKFAEEESHLATHHGKRS